MSIDWKAAFTIFLAGCALISVVAISCFLVGALYGVHRLSDSLTETVQKLLIDMPREELQKRADLEINRCDDESSKVDQ